jgi:hypothetical protein
MHQIGLGNGSRKGGDDDDRQSERWFAGEWRDTAAAFSSVMQRSGRMKQGGSDHLAEDGDETTLIEEAMIRHAIEESMKEAASTTACTSRIADHGCDAAFAPALGHPSRFLGRDKTARRSTKNPESRSVHATASETMAQDEPSPLFHHRLSGNRSSYSRVGGDRHRDGRSSPLKFQRYFPDANIPAKRMSPSSPRMETTPPMIVASDPSGCADGGFEGENYWCQEIPTLVDATTGREGKVDDDEEGGRGGRASDGDDGMGEKGRRWQPRSAMVTGIERPDEGKGGWSGERRRSRLHLVANIEERGSETRKRPMRECTRERGEETGHGAGGNWVSIDAEAMGSNPMRNMSTREETSCEGSTRAIAGPHPYLREVHIEYDDLRNGIRKSEESSRRETERRRAEHLRWMAMMPGGAAESFIVMLYNATFVLDRFATSVYLAGSVSDRTIYGDTWDAAGARDVVRLRLVCRSWKVQVDGWMRERDITCCVEYDGFIRYVGSSRKRPGKGKSVGIPTMFRPPMIPTAGGGDAVNGECGDYWNVDDAVKSIFGTQVPPRMPVLRSKTQ